MIERKEYIEEVLPFVNKPFIKILTGIRRSGKSTIMLMLIKELKKQRIEEKQIFHTKFDGLEYEDYTAKDILKLLKSKLVEGKRTYLFLDEVQEIEGWEKAVNELFDSSKYNVDIFLTGSNSRMLSSEISTYLTGRYVHFNIYPLSFEEYLQFINNNEDIYKKFVEYIKIGGFPAIHANGLDVESAYLVVNDIYKTIVFTDIVKRNNIRNIGQLERIVKFVIENIGKTFSANTISNYFKSQNRTIDIETIYNYLTKLESAYIINRCSRYDLQGKEILKTQEKFYLTDLAIKYSLVGYNETSVASSLENIVYIELKRRGYEVCIGKLKELEIDFVGEKQGEKIYIQVARKINRAKDGEEKSDVEKREYENLLKITDNYPKYVLTMENTARWKL